MQKKIDALKKMLGGMNGGTKGAVPIKATIVAKNPEGLKEGAEKLEEISSKLSDAEPEKQEDDSPKFTREELLEKFKKMLDPEV